jgi:hypothetical protein
MSTLAEIESAADRLPRSQQELLLRHLAAKLQLAPASRETPATATSEVVEWPNYEARLRAIYGDNTMPSMVLAERETASW